MRRRRIRQLEIELAVPGRSTGSSLFRAWPQKPVPGDLIRDRAGFDVQRAYLMLGLPQSGYYASKERPPSERTLRHLWPSGEVTDIHDASAGTYGAQCVTAELRCGRHRDPLSIFSLIAGAV